jgi:Flp pilus assembly protein protease CpaA
MDILDFALMVGMAAGTTAAAIAVLGFDASLNTMILVTIVSGGAMTILIMALPVMIEKWSKRATKRQHQEKDEQG